jgi:hypothetical protein
MHKESFVINCNTLLYVSTLLGHLQGELFCYCYTKVALYSWVRMCCWLSTALFLEALTVCGPGLQTGTAESLHLQKQRSTQSTAHSHSTVKCNLSVTVKKSSPWKWPSRVETCRSVLRLMVKLSLCICWWLVLLYILFFLFVINSQFQAFHLETSHGRKGNQHRNRCWYRVIPDWIV